MQLQGLAGRVTGIARASASGQLPQQVRHIYGQLHAGCMISAHAHVAAQGALRQLQGVAGGGTSSRRWPEHAHWPQSCCHMFKARVLCCNASSKWAVSGRDRQPQRNDHGSDHSWMARVLCCNASSNGQSLVETDSRSRQ